MGTPVTVTFCAGAFCAGTLGAGPAGRVSGAARRDDGSDMGTSPCTVDVVDGTYAESGLGRSWSSRFRGAASALAGRRVGGVFAAHRRPIFLIWPDDYGGRSSSVTAGRAIPGNDP